MEKGLEGGALGGRRGKVQFAIKAASRETDSPSGFVRGDERRGGRRLPDVEILPVARERDAVDTGGRIDRHLLKRSVEEQ
jgi:hypothetical protein